MQNDIIKLLEDNYEVILNEYKNITNNLTPWIEPEIYNKGWDTFGLYFKKRKLKNNCLLCPETTKIVESITGMTTAGFSRMAPDTKILPHKGYTSRVLRYHLGLICPDDCGMRVDNKIHTWKSGVSFVFDDTLEHEAWNNSKTERVILLLDAFK